MAEQAASAVASAVIGQVTEMAFTRVIRKLRSGSGSGPAAAHEKLQRLETLVLKLRCAVEVSEKHAVGSASLLEWRDRLRVAAAEAGAAVLDFQRRAACREEDGGCDAAAASVIASAPGQQQRPAAGALYFTRSALGGMAQRVRDATRRLFSADEGMQKKLDGALEKMERLSPDITQFLLALQLEVSSELDQRPAAKKRKLAVVTSKHEVMMKSGEPRVHKIKKFAATSAIVQLASAAAEAPLDPGTEARMLASVFKPTLLFTESYCVKKTDARDMRGLEWLPEWVSVLREAVERGNAVLQTLRPGADVFDKSGSGLEEDGELYCFARVVERLAEELEDPCFAVLVDLCPSKQ